MRFYSKSQCAFVMSVRKLFEESSQVYFWTFTFVQVMPDWYYPRSWNVLMKDVQNLYGGMLQGLRVLEVHPGGHGLHYHALVNRRICVHLINRMAKKVGMGITHVQRADVGAGEYLAKYLIKENPLWPGMRRWGTIGGFRQVKKNNIRIDSVFHRNLAECNPEGRQFPFQHINWIYQQSMLHGDWRDWPVNVRKNTLDKLGETSIVSEAMDTLSNERKSKVREYVMDADRRMFGQSIYTE